ncbi:MAG: hypothetical protein AB7O24_28600 [Kofleriaceae bacterium]
MADAPDPKANLLTGTDDERIAYRIAYGDHAFAMRVREQQRENMMAKASGRPQPYPGQVLGTNADRQQQILAEVKALREMTPQQRREFNRQRGEGIKKALGLK